MIIDQEKQENLNKYAQSKKIRFIVLFGSAVKGTSRLESDFDIAIYLYNEESLFKNLKEHSEILNKLGEILDIDSNKIDLVDLNEANILLRYEITSGGKLLYGNELDFIQYQCFAFRDYVDARPLFELENLIINKRQKFLKEILI
ncbi:MAG: nucleotidyltransferase domain-containing protein [Patescibacteria group bacterium]